MKFSLINIMNYPDTYISKEEFEALDTTNQKKEFALPAIILALFQSHNRELLDLMVERGYNLNNYTWSLLHGLTMYKSPEALEFAKYVLTKGADIELIKSGRTPLLDALYWKNIEQIKMYIEQGANIFAKLLPMEEEALIQIAHNEKLCTKELFTTLVASSHFNWDKLLTQTTKRLNSEAPNIIMALNKLCEKKQFDCVEVLINSIPSRQTLHKVEKAFGALLNYSPYKGFELIVSQREKELLIIEEKASLEQIVPASPETAVAASKKLTKI